MMQQTTTNLTDTQRDQLRKLAEAHGTTPERLVTAALRRDTREREAARASAAPVAAGRRFRRVGFHIGESVTGLRRR